MNHIKIDFVKLCIAVFAISILGCATKHGSNDNTFRIEYELVENWPKLSQNYILSQPTGIGIDTNDNIFVFHRTGRGWTDPFPDSLISQNTILKLENKTGKILNSWGANYFIMPHGLSVDKNNNIWVTDVALHQIFKFSSNGELLMKLGIAKTPGNDSLHFNMPTDVAVANDGCFFVSDGYGNSRVVKFSPSGKYLFDWGEYGNKQSEFNIPHGISVDKNDNVYVADRENNRIQVFNSNGIFIKELKNNVQVAQLPSVTIDNYENVFAIDFDFNDTVINGSTILEYDSTDKILYQFGGLGTNKRTISWYHDISLDKNGNIYVGDIHNKRVLKFRKKYF
jgi:peptidylamidoglycolate lyase